MRELRVEDALMYLDQVKMEFGDRPQIYNEFLDIMKTFKSQEIDTPGVIRRVAALFHGNKRLVLGFNTFLPEGFRIELPLDGSPFPVYREPGRPGVIQIPLPGNPNFPSASAAGAAGRMGDMKPAAMPSSGKPPAAASQPPPRPGMQSAASAPGGMLRAPPPPVSSAFPPPGSAVPPSAAASRSGGGPQGASGMPPSSGQQRFGGGPSQFPPAAASAAATPGPSKLPAAASKKPSSSPTGQTSDLAPAPVEFDHAINYVTTIKKRFHAHPEIYRKFLEILHTYQKEQRGIKEVLDEVSVLFADHADLLKEFTYFLPDAVQSQAKAQLDIAAAKAEERAKQRVAQAKALDNGGPGPSPAMASPPGAAPPANFAPSPAGGMILPPPPAAHVGSAQKRMPSVPSNIPRTPFGATKARSEDRENEIAATAQHGKVSFDPVRPPRRNELNTAQASQMFGRPKVIPAEPLQPMTAEIAFFKHVKAHFNRKDLFPDLYNPTIKRRHTPYEEFIKCIHIFGAGMLSKDELIQLLRGLFIQGNAPKSGANSTNITGNSMIIQASNVLLSELEQVLIGRGPFTTQEKTKKYRAKYGSYPLRDYDLTELSKNITPSYWSYPSDYSVELPGVDSDESVLKLLNSKCFSMAKDWPEKGKNKLKSPESYDGVKIRRNIYEEVLCRVEDEMYEVDMAIERNESALRKLEPIAEEATRLRELEEKDGQPIGRLQYKLNLRSLNTIHIGSIARIYGDSGDEVIQHLLRNPLVVVPIVCKRLQEKDAEWRKVKTELAKEWKLALSENAKGSTDVKCLLYRREIEKSFTTERLIEECQEAKSFAKDPSKIQRHPATNMILPDFHLSNQDQQLSLYQPHLSVLVSEMMPHKDAHDLLAAQFRGDRNKFSKLWSGFMAPWFGLPSTFESNESSTAAMKFSPGQKVRTTVGDGQIISIAADPQRYKIKFSFGVGYVHPDAIAHLLPSSSSAADVEADHSQLMQDDIQILFGTENSYLLMRLYMLLVTILYQAKDAIEGDGYTSCMAAITDFVKSKTDVKEFESAIRGIIDKNVFNIVAIPSLVQSCGDAMAKVVEEDVIENLYHCSQLKLKDLNQLRSLSIDVTEEAVYRLQISSAANQVFFSYIPADVELQLSNTSVKRPLESVEKNDDMKIDDDTKRLKTE
ncbi:hypothetical protein ACHAWT_008414 [Skeletonema menzelii]